MQLVEMELLMSDFPVLFQVMYASSVLSVVIFIVSESIGRERACSLFESS